jgi:hypothetical protein
MLQSALMFRDKMKTFATSSQSSITWSSFIIHNVGAPHIDCQGLQKNPLLQLL